MAVFDWPEALIPQTCIIGSQSAGEDFKSPYNGTLQQVDFVAERFTLNATLPQRRRANAGATEAFLFRLRGGGNRVRAWHFSRPVPAGTLRGAPTLKTTVNRGASSVVLQGATPDATLLAGDLISIGNQLLMVAENCVVDGLGDITVPLIHRVRATLTAGAAVVWNKPTAEFTVPARFASVSHFPGGIESAALDLEEYWAP